MVLLALEDESSGTSDLGLRRVIMATPSAMKETVMALLHPSVYAQTSASPGGSGLWTAVSNAISRVPDSYSVEEDETIIAHCQLIKT
jgi:hypothetical protein